MNNVKYGLKQLIALDEYNNLIQKLDGVYTLKRSYRLIITMVIIALFYFVKTKH